MFFDTHAHLDDSDFDPIREQVIQRARSAGVVGIVVVGTTAVSSRRCVELARQYPDYLHAAVGIQPNYVAQAEADDWEKISEMILMPGVRAIGETGLDGYWDDSPMGLQQEYFVKHIELSVRSGRPLIIHMRDSCEEIIQTLRPFASRRRLVGVMHSFTGTWQQAQTLLDFGLYISFAGMVTFKKSNDLRDVARRVPADRLLVETDSPYLSPEPMRGKKPNEPERVLHTLRCLARVRGVTEQELARTTTANAKHLLGLGQCFRSSSNGY